MFNVLDGDGVIDNIYHFLWTKDTIFHTDPSVYIPHTILFKYNKPYYWYFTSVVDHKLKKKNLINLNKEHIKKVFLKNVSESGIVCYFIYEKMNKSSKYESDKPTYEKIMKKIMGNLDNIKSNEENKNDKRIKSSYPNKNYKKKDKFKLNNKNYIIEYYDENQFIDFLENRIKHDEGILQKFIDPKGEHNTIYRITWSPKLSLFEKCSNLRKLYDKHFDIYERAVTYDGEEFQSKIEPLKGRLLPEKMQQIALNIAEHVSNITLEKIKIIRMILNFKVDKNDRIIFLWCSSLRIEQGQRKKNLNSLDNKSLSKINSDKVSETRIKSVDESKIKLFPPDNINLFKYSMLGKPIQPHKEAYCLNCGLNVENYRLYEISFKHLIESHENIKRDKQFYPLYKNLNMTSTGIEVLPFEEKKKNKINDQKYNAINTLKENNFHNFIIPKVISRLYPKLSFSDYFSLKKDIIFLTKRTVVCDTCYLEITKYCSMAGSNNEYLLRTVRKGDFNNSKLIRPKSAKRINKVNIDIQNDKFNNIKNNNLVTSFLSKKKLENIYKNSNLYKNYITNLAVKKKEVKRNMKLFVIQNSDKKENNEVKNNEQIFMNNKFNKNRGRNNNANITFNDLKGLNTDSNKHSFIKNRTNSYSFLTNYTNNKTESKEQGSMLDLRKPLPFKIKKINLNSTNHEPIKENNIKNFLDKGDFEYFN